MRRCILLFALLLAACGTPETVARPTPAPIAPATSVAAADPCAAADLQAYRAAYGGVVERWGLAVIQANQASPENLKTPIGQLEQISGEMAALTPPQCARQAHDNTVQAMQQTIEGYQDLMAQKDVGQRLRAAIDSMAIAQAEVSALPGKPAATPTLLPTFTPLPTITPTPTVTPTPTMPPPPEPRAGYMSKQAQLFESPTSVNPIRTIFKGTLVEVFETQKGRTRIRAGNIEGWVPQGSVVIR